MVKRKIITIDEEKCNGCGLCIPNCPEGALQIIDGKARLVSDLNCDGLGACIGHCPEHAIRVEEKEAQPYDELAVMDQIVHKGDNLIRAHLKHLQEHGEDEYFKQAITYLKKHNKMIDIESLYKDKKEKTQFHQCPGTIARSFASENQGLPPASATQVSALTTWPIQLKLVPPFAPFLKNADITIAADCAPFAYADFHRDFLKNKVVLIGCPKLDDQDYYVRKLISIFTSVPIKSISCVHMEVPCCFGLPSLIQAAIDKSGTSIPFEDITLSIKGQRK
ncbi:MAG: 4Fe-4S dicluster domain-containing protein [Elusimicrobia bacterium]|nr:4Fe-4S dicluster domain-containing protein [Elusimicrobiota bacterium]MBD3412177.1 4Fe-4S dicluster domain-containing protein [Elusimicrobiota bacterium]